MYNDLMLAPSGLSKLEREMIAVVVSSINKCFLLPCGAWAGRAAIVGRSGAGRGAGDELPCCPLDARQRAMLDFAALMTTASATIEERDRAGCAMSGSVTAISGTSPTWRVFST